MDNNSKGKVIYDLKGSFAITTPFLDKDQTEISQLSSVIMVSDLLRFHSFWHFLRAPIACELHRLIMKEGFRDTPNTLRCDIDYSRYVAAEAKKIEDDEWKKKCVKVVGSQEMKINNDYAVVVDYKLELTCWPATDGKELEACVANLEPNHIWLKSVDLYTSTLSEIFFGTEIVRHVRPFVQENLQYV